MIQQIISNIVSSLSIEDSSPSTAPVFIHGWNGWNNLQADEVEDTLVLLVEPLTSNDRLVGNLIQESYPVLMVFLEKTELDSTPTEELVHTDRMRRMKNKFIYALKNSSLILDVTDIISTDVFKEKDGCFSGVSIQFKVVPLNSSAVC